MREFLVVLVVLFVVMLCGSQVRLDSSDHSYRPGDLIPLYANKVGPLKNPRETYGYYDLPFCLPDHIEEKKKTLGEALNGDHLVGSLYRLTFLLNKDSEILCRKKLKKEEVSQFRAAVGCLVSFYTKVLIKKDLTEHSYDEESCDNQEETGWKILHGDVFRYPNHKSLFAAAIGSGTQLLTITTLVLIFWLVGVFYPYNRGYLLTAVVIMYAITSFVAGYVGTSFYCSLGGTNCVKNLLLTGSLSSGPMFSLLRLLSTVSTSSRTLMVLNLVWLLFALPLLVLGGILGKSTRAEFQAPCSTFKCPREVPALPWYRGALPQMALTGLIPFSVIYTEIQYVLDSMWGHRINLAYDVLIVVFFILLNVTALVTVAVTFSQLSAEDHQWWWRSFICAGSTGLYVYCYSFYYYYELSAMSGFLQTSFFFGYMAIISFGFFIMLGTVGFLASFIFVCHIYRSIRCD